MTHFLQGLAWVFCELDWLTYLSWESKKNDPSQFKFSFLLKTSPLGEMMKIGEVRCVPSCFFANLHKYFISWLYLPW